jgi:hypothetical protein
MNHRNTAIQASRPGMRLGLPIGVAKPPGRRLTSIAVTPCRITVICPDRKSEHFSDARQILGGRMR